MVHLHLSSYQRLVQVVTVGLKEIVCCGDGGGGWIEWGCAFWVWWGEFVKVWGNGYIKERWTKVSVQLLTWQRAQPSYI